MNNMKIRFVVFDRLLQTGICRHKLNLIELFFLALTSRAAPVVGKILKFSSRRNILLRVAFRRIVDVPAGSFVPSVSQTDSITFIVFCHFCFLLIHWICIKLC